MISYEIYKLIHLIAIFIFLITFGISLYLAKEDKRLLTLSWLSLFLMLIAGMGLLARVGVVHGDPWPFWVKVKLLIWIILAMSSALILKKAKKFSRYFIVMLIILAAISSASAIFHFN